MISMPETIKPKNSNSVKHCPNLKEANCQWQATRKSPMPIAPYILHQQARAFSSFPMRRFPETVEVSSTIPGTDFTDYTNTSANPFRTPANTNNPRAQDLVKRSVPRNEMFSPHHHPHPPSPSPTN